MRLGVNHLHAYGPGRHSPTQEPSSELHVAVRAAANHNHAAMPGPSTSPPIPRPRSRSPRAPPATQQHLRTLSLPYPARWCRRPKPSTPGLPVLAAGPSASARPPTPPRRLAVGHPARRHGGVEDPRSRLVVCARCTVAVKLVRRAAQVDGAVVGPTLRKVRQEPLQLPIAPPVTRVAQAHARYVGARKDVLVRREVHGVQRNSAGSPNQRARSRGGQGVAWTRRWPANDAKQAAGRPAAVHRQT
jgi:hypothetical protein